MLPERRGIILKIIVSEYTTSGIPVASESIARRYALGVSPATTRHEMAHLEEEGYISRPHVSAGGVPSDKGYRYYVEYLIKEAKLSDEEQHAIQQLIYQAEQELEEWARLAATFLSQRLKSIALVTLPRASVCHFRHLDLIALQEYQVLFVLLLQEGEIKQLVLTLEQAVSQDELTALANHLNAVYKGLDYSQIDAQEIELSPLEEQIAVTILQTMQVEDKQQYDQFYLSGWRHLLSQPEFIKGEKTLSLVEALEEGSLLNSLLGSLGHEPGVKVVIGNENEEEALRGCSVILSNYGIRVRGTIGVIGPTRLLYHQAIPIVDYLSSVMSGVVNEIYA
ncbi:MAG TPA: heat-inducible transcriptional repressor HrcA [Dehalococcoidia bacterium]|nr:heat-inducible transcriptional repressor HrcA [Dehalococcoidia bacterium]